MTDYYKILGVEKNASKEEVKEAYEKQVEKLKKEVVNEKRLNQFLKICNEAYEALNSLEQKHLIEDNSTLIMNPQEVQKELEKHNKGSNYTCSDNFRNKERRTREKKNDSIKKVVLQNKDKGNKVNDNKEKRERTQKAIEKRSKSNTKSILNLFMLPFKILALPVIAVLTVAILLLQIINLISWIATKLLIVGSISAGAIHLYQVKLGQPINYNILIFAASVLLASFFLPYILKFALKVLKTMNNVLKEFVF
ncbi:MULTISPECIES: DnaJ domain-containing protein [unclassified Clostridium]|uniref:J domain-containing protein n=1 Tax=unclassified Clostridium TaxID=2614128 RepID=UPI000297B0EF|nr:MULTISPECIES: DnaJ domain-containing protein [unclassified Clostridium]EKQ50202.1 MAG: DnaJ-class molecular chaperone [Clostridium sp. Maddingley MBC34-26]